MLFQLLACEKPHRQQDLHGVWEGHSKSMGLVLRFFDDGTCQFRITNLESGSTETLTGNLETNFSKHPVPLTLRNIPGINHPLHTILEFVDDDSIRVGHFAPRWRLRPVIFGPNSVYLKRVDRDPHADT